MMLLPQLNQFISSQWLLLAVPGCPVQTDPQRARRTTPSDYLQNQFQNKFKTLRVLTGYFCIMSPWQGYMSGLPFLPALLRRNFYLPRLLSGYWNKSSLKHLTFKASLGTTSVTDEHIYHDAEDTGTYLHHTSLCCALIMQFELFHPPQQLSVLFQQDLNIFAIPPGKRAQNNPWNSRKHKNIRQNTANASHWKERLSGRRNPEVCAGLVVKHISISLYFCLFRTVIMPVFCKTDD